MDVVMVLLLVFHCLRIYAGVILGWGRRMNSKLRLNGKDSELIHLLQSGAECGTPNVGNLISFGHLSPKPGDVEHNLAVISLRMKRRKASHSHVFWYSALLVALFST